MPDGSVEASALGSDRGGNTWDQFAVNEKLFGVTTDFNEELYTTKLDKNSEEYKRREKEAAMLAKQIEKVSKLILEFLLIKQRVRQIMSTWRKSAVWPSTIAKWTRKIGSANMRIICLIN